MLRKIKKNIRVGYAFIGERRARMHERRPRGWHLAGGRSQKDMDRQVQSSRDYVNNMHEALMKYGEFGSVIRFPRLSRHVGGRRA